jgi:pimeloyl-ACP methyl ester carboxylesterase
MTLVRVDLHASVRVSNVSMTDYAEMVAEACADADGPVALCGWSMGGLAAMMAAGLTEVAALALLEPSAPAEIQGTHPVPPARGTFDPEEVYGAFPQGIASRPESERARADRKRGISVPTLPGRSLVVYGDEFADERGRAVARFYGIEEAHFPGLSHWDLVLDGSVAGRVLDHLFGGFVCPVCGWPDLTEAPRSPGGGGSYEICPSCGFQFGVTDDDAGISYAEWRRRWVEGGAKRRRLP